MNNHTISMQDLLVTQTLSRELIEYRIPSPVGGRLASCPPSAEMFARAKRSYSFIRKPKMELMPGLVQPSHLDIIRYKELLFRAVHEILQRLGISETGYLARPATSFPEAF